MIRMIGFSLVIALVGCGGDNASDGDYNKIEDSKNDLAGDVIINSIYQSEDAVMLVDTEASNNGVIIVDNSGYLYSFDNETKTTDSMLLTGVHVRSAYQYYYDLSQEVSISFSDSSADVATSINKQPFVHSFTRKAYSLRLDQLKGIYLNSDDEAQWMIDEVGNLVIDSVCYLSGKLKQANYYYSLDVTAEQYDKPELNGEYSGVFFTVSSNGKAEIYSVLNNNEHQIFGSVTIN
ncbi:hypothetical protein MD588_11295 [Photobacterium sp. SDRW27]|uniref:hypothetical protein n=1 Tax=Photobacterium obscurum TaxID=2829490 RepID=UPI00224475D3|nr:hypothetical protein [Photobacterium obscurum]MCW8329393.1 hypothetical protein [Photobacterium obscurum]